MLKSKILNSAQTFFVDVPIMVKLIIICIKVLMKLKIFSSLSFNISQYLQLMCNIIL